MRPGWRKLAAALVLAVVVAGGCSSTNQKSTKAATGGAPASEPGAAEEISPGPAGAGDAASTPVEAPPLDGAAAGGTGAVPGTAGPATKGVTGGGGVPTAGPAGGSGGTNTGSPDRGQAGAADRGARPGGSGDPPPSQAAGPPGAAAPAPAPPPKLGGPESGQGFTATTISVGITLIDETASRGAGLIGAKSTDFGNTRLQAQSIVDHVNANGGIAGRKVVPVFHTINILSETWDTSAQGTCSAFTEDNKTVAGIAAVIQLSEVFTHCLARHGTIPVANGRGVRDDRMIGELGNLVSMPGRVSATRWGALTVEGLSELGYFDAGAKVGLIRFDTAPLNRTVTEVMKPRLAARKVNVAADEIISHPESVNGFGATSAQISNAVLRMRSAGVTHVLPVDDHGILVYLLLPQAESQGFRPRYGVSTNNLPFVMEENAPKEQLKGAVGVGWLPGDDVAAPRTPDSPAEKLCAGILKKAGADLPSRYAYSNAMNYCDSLLFLQAAFSRAPSLSVPGFRAGAAALGTSYASPYTFATDFGRRRVDGASAWRAFRFQADCGCFRYEGGDRPF